MATDPTSPISLGILIVWERPLPTLDHNSLFRWSTINTVALSHSKTLQIDYTILSSASSRSKLIEIS